MDSDIATQDFVPVHEEEDEHNELLPENAWGLLMPLRREYQTTVLINNSHKVGRQGDVQLQPSVPLYSNLGRIHFEIQKTNDGIIIRDLSANGTFVNGDKIGKDKCRILPDESEIALCAKNNKSFMFLDIINKEKFPKSVTDKYTITKKLGSGAYGEVRIAFKNDTLEKLAVKIIQKKTFSIAPGSNNIASEVAILKRIRHPCIVRFEDALESDDYLFIFLELAEGGELFDRIVADGQLSENVSKLFFYQMVLAIKYLHDSNISHRDLKPENILLASTVSETLIKITDFGISKFVDGKTMLKTCCGTPTYLAPEVIQSENKLPYTNACDVWSLGVILFICLAGYPPFTEERTDTSLHDQITTGSYSFPRKFWSSVSNEAIDLIKQILVVDPEMRITLDGILEHTWMKDDGMKMAAHKLMYPNEFTTIENGGDAKLLLTAEPVMKKRKK